MQGEQKTDLGVEQLEGDVGLGLLDVVNLDEVTATEPDVLADVGGVELAWTSGTVSLGASTDWVLHERDLAGLGHVLR